MHNGGIVSSKPFHVSECSQCDSENTLNSLFLSLMWFIICRTNSISENIPEKSSEELKDHEIARRLNLDLSCLSVKSFQTWLSELRNRNSCFKASPSSFQTTTHVFEPNNQRKSRWQQHIRGEGPQVCSWISVPCPDLRCSSEWSPGEDEEPVVPAGTRPHKGPSVLPGEWE